MWGLKFRCEGIYFVSFRKPVTTSLSLTYKLPPFTAIRGMIGNALGMPRDSFEIQNWFKIGMRVEGKIEIGKEMAKFLKMISRKSCYKCEDCGFEKISDSKPKKCPNCGKENIVKVEKIIYERAFPSSPMHREFLIMPKYWIYLVGEEKKINQIYNALKNPERPLYLGTSDDLVDIEVFEPVKVKEVEENEINSILDGIYENCILEKLPYKFIPVKDIKGKLKEVYSEYKLVSIPRKFPYLSENPIKVWDFGDEFIRVF